MKHIIHVCFTFFVISLTAQDTFIHCGSLFTAENKELQSRKTIIVSDNKIKDIRNGYLTPENGETIINLTQHTVMPGFMDMHVHIEHESNPKRYEQRFRENEADRALKATQYCERTLMAGFTTVRDLGGSGVNVSLQKAINRGFVVGPRIYTAEKSLATTGGHADPSNGVRKDLMGDPGPKEGVINSIDDAKKAVRQRYKNGADCIKITATGGVLSVAKDGQGPQFTIEEVKAVVDAANDYGFVTAAHAHGAEGMKRAILGGIHSIEHGTLMNDEVMGLMKEHGTYLVPTIMAGKFAAAKAEIPGYFPEMVAKKAREIGPQIQNTFAKAYRAGVKIAFGTDSGVSAHGQNAKEFQYMVEAGMPPAEALLSATKAASELMRIDDILGSISKGKFADIIGVRGNPLEDIRLLQDIDFVMKAGIVYKKL